MLPHTPSELILNPDGSVYHLGLKGEDIPNLIFTVGDPDRVGNVTQHFDSIAWTKERREFTIVRGTLKGKEVLVLSTGMGTDNIDIVLNELDAAVNIDPITRMNRANLRKLTIIRIGTSGAIDPNIPLGTHLLSAGALSFDGLLPFYQHPFKTVTVSGAPFNPFYIPAPCNMSSTEAIPELMLGITATLPGFYAPQGRSIRTTSVFKEAMDALHHQSYDGHTLTNFEMETAGIYALATLLGHEAYSFSALLANRAAGTFHDQPAQAVESLIRKVLDWAVVLDA
ncbi:MAG: phosphorylase [Bacteroidetes bacterium]|nr:MAG: phosphorylase [Bacteroidota bacterium]PTM18725.1 MAG: phosphorylase [Bacteroidota bacterium]